VGGDMLRECFNCTESAPLWNLTLIDGTIYPICAECIILRSNLMVKKKKEVNYDVNFTYIGDDNDYYTLDSNQCNDLQECIASGRKWFDYETDSGTHWYINLENITHFSIQESEDE
jgi:hypothetical protein